MLPDLHLLVYYTIVGANGRATMGPAQAMVGILVVVVEAFGRNLERLVVVKTARAMVAENKVVCEPASS